MTSQLVMVGAGGYAREILSSFFWPMRRSSQWVCGGYTALKPSEILEGSLGIPWLGNDEGFVSVSNFAGFIIGISNPKARGRLERRYSTLGLTAITLIHERSIIGPDVSLASGVLISADTVLTVNVAIGEGTHVDRGASIGHDVTVGQYTTIHPRAVIAGGVIIGSGVVIGTNATVLPGLSISDAAIVGAGAVVTRNVDAGQVVVGCPARPLPLKSWDGN